MFPVSLGERDTSGVGWLDRTGTVFRLLRNCQTVLRSDCTIFRPRWVRAPWLPSVAGVSDFLCVHFASIHPSGGIYRASIFDEALPGSQDSGREGEGLGLSPPPPSPDPSCASECHLGLEVALETGVAPAGLWGKCRFPQVVWSDPMLCVCSPVGRWWWSWRPMAHSL